MYADLCNGDNFINDIRVIVDSFIYKNKYCALCHGLQTYSPLTLEIENFKQPTDISGSQTTVPDESRFTWIKRHQRHR